ncbi:MAG: HlyC/CorC family transporter [Chloroflexi bacterium]|nr:HlyC/CorC family transporter [Chloroflexota bacterium]
MIEIYIILFVLCLIISAFFSSSETAFISLQKSRLRQMVDSGVSGAEDIVELTKRPERLLTTVLIGNNFVNTAAAALGTLIVVNYIDSKGWSALVATITVTILLLVFSEIAPKTMATQMNERMALLYARPIKAISWLLSPITYVLSGIGIAVSKLFGGNSMNHTPVSEDEMRAMITMGREDGAVEEGEADIMERVFLLGDLQVGEIMTPRTDIIWVEKDTTMGDFLSIYAENSHSRFPVFDETVDNIVGMLWIKDVLRALAQGNSDSESSVTELARPTFYVPETKIVGELFAEMQEQRMQVTIVVDEYGGTAGIATMEQLLEEIVGELGDELASGRKTVETIGINTYQVDGGMRLDQANEEIELGLPEGDYETVAGFILNALGHIPKEGEQLKYADMTITVTEMKGVKIEKVLIAKE